MSESRQTQHPTLTLPFSERAKLPETPLLTSYLLRLMAAKHTNLCLSADVQSTNQLLDIAEECGDSICILKTHADIISDFGEKTIRGLMEVARRKKFLVFEDRKFGDIGSTVQMQYGAGSHRIASWASIINAHILPGPAIITALRSAAFSAVSAYNSSFTTEITGGPSVKHDGYFSKGKQQVSSDDTDEDEPDEEEPDEDTDEESEVDDLDGLQGQMSYQQRRSGHTSPNGAFPFNHRKSSIVSISTTISTEYVSPPSTNMNGSTRFLDQPPPLARGLLLLAQLSSADNLISPGYTKRCVELARAHKDFVLGFIAQESLNSAPGDNFVVMTPGVNLPPTTDTESASNGRSYNASRLLVRSTAGSRQAQQHRHITPKASSNPPTGDGTGQQYNTPRDVILRKGVDVIIVGRGILHADDRGMEAERYRRESWKAILERCGSGA